MPTNGIEELLPDITDAVPSNPTRCPASENAIADSIPGDLLAPKSTTFFGLALSRTLEHLVANMERKFIVLISRVSNNWAWIIDPVIWIIGSPPKTISPNLFRQSKVLEKMK